MNRFAVVDTETTGFGKTDRIIEIGIVLVDGNEIIQEWETLINPERDISNSNIHGITSEIVSLAPIFAEVIDEISGFLDGRIFVAHNVAFDKKMLEFEFNRLGREIEFGETFCTLQATGTKLEKACERFGITNSEAHRALTDARATSMILAQVFDPKISKGACIVSNYSNNKIARTFSRTAFNKDNEVSKQNIRRISKNFEFHGADGPLLSYLDALASLLSDFHLTKEESIQLKAWAHELGLSEENVLEANRQFVASIVEAAERDNYISETEIELIEKISGELDIEYQPNSLIEGANIEVTFSAGIRVCFTGTARGLDGSEITREYLEEIANSRGLVPVNSVTKKSCDLLVAADKSSMSGKAKKARDFGITVISVTEFLERI